MTGRTIGHFEILEKLGEGGMGVVWKARDSHLDRLVAVKVLPPGKVADPDRERRFVQEARAASALNHPNIVTIYDISHADGVDFIAMEYVAGKTLDRLIPRKGLRLNETLNYSIQIAAALTAAHAAGIIHRDLKPGNVMVSDNGMVKVLDFGLAKLTEPSQPAELERTQTLADRLETEQGVILGTISYMSPEQAESKKVDARSDIFAFGALLYEMTTGRRAFQDETKLSTLAAILHKEPSAVREIAADTPRDLERIITRCLRKDPNRRFQNIADVKVALEELKEESESGQLLVPGAPAVGRTRFPWWAVAVALFALLAVSLAIYYRSRNAASVAHRGLVRLTFDSGLTFYPALSPDGKLLVFASDRSGEGNLDIWVKQIAGGEPLRLTHGPADSSQPSFSPDGARIVYHSGSGLANYVMPALGGDARELAYGFNPRFSPDGQWVSSWGAGGRAGRADTAGFLVPASGGTRRRIVPDFASTQSFWAGDATHLMFWGGPAGVPFEAWDWYVTTVAGGPPVQTHLAGALRTIGARTSIVNLDEWAAKTPVMISAPEGRLSVVLSAVVGDTENLWAIPLSPKTWQPAGAPERLTFGAALEVSPSAASGGRIAFASINRKASLWELTVVANRAAGMEPSPLTTDAATKSYPSLSADGKTLAFLSDRSGKTEVWVKDLETGKERSVTNDGVAKARLQIAPDGSSIAFYASNGIQSVSRTGGLPEAICANCGWPESWSPGGSLLMYLGTTGIDVLNVRDRSDNAILKHPPDHPLRSPRFCPDGQWVSFVQTLGPDRRRIYVARLRGSAPISQTDWLPITSGKTVDREPRWSPDGNLLYSLSTRDGYNCIWSQRLDSGKHPAGEPVAVLHLHGARRNLNVADTGPIGLAVAPGRIVFAMTETTGNIWMLE